MSFVYPNFLWALLFLAIPIIIHLFHFRRYKKILFPNVKFLQSVQKQTQSVKKVRNILVLLARLLAITFLVLAFAQPYIPINKNLETGDQIIGLYIDNSFSMENEGSQGPLIEQAKEKARNLVKAYPASDRFIVHTNHSNSLHPINREDAIAFIDDIDIEKSSRDLSEVLELIKRSLVDNGAGRKYMYVFSDLQKQGDSPSGILDSNDVLSFVPLLANENNNISIDSAWFESPVIHLNEPIELNVSLTNHGELPISSTSISMEINGVKKAVSSFALDGNSSGIVKLGFTLSQGGWQNATLSIEDAPIIFDDTYYLSFNIKPKIKILIANGGEQSPYLNALFKADSYFEVVNEASGNIDLSSVRTSDLVILNELTTISGGLISALGEYVSTGGSLLLVPSATAQSNYLQNLTQSLGLLNYTKRLDQKTEVGQIDLDHPLFDKVFKKIPRNPDYPKIQRYIRMESSGKASYGLLTLANQDIFLSASKLGNGNIFQLATPLNSDWSNFQQHGLFVPMVLKMAMNRSLDYPLAYQIGNTNLFKAVPEAKDLQGELILAQEGVEWMPVVRSSSASAFVDGGYDDLTAGNVKLKANDSLLQLVAFNYNRAESVNSYYTNDQIKEMMPENQISFVDNPTAFVSETINDLRFGKRYWKWCIILALIFLAIEILLLRFWPNEART